MTQKTVVFDFGGVIFRTSVREFYHDRFKEQGKTLEQLDYFLAHVFTDADRSVSNVGDIKGLINLKLQQYPEWAEEIRAFGADQSFLKTVRSVIPGMEELLTGLSVKRHRVHGLTNWAGDTFDLLPIAYPEILEHFEKIVVSGKVHKKKPDPEIFLLAQKEFCSPDPAQVYYFDDKPKNVKAARETVGWNSFVFESPETVRRALALTP